MVELEGVVSGLPTVEATAATTPRRTAISATLLFRTRTGTSTALSCLEVTVAQLLAIPCAGPLDVTTTAPLPAIVVAARKRPTAPVHVAWSYPGAATAAAKVPRTTPGTLSLGPAPASFEDLTVTKGAQALQAFRQASQAGVTRDHGTKGLASTCTQRAPRICWLSQKFFLTTVPRIHGFRLHGNTGPRG